MNSEKNINLELLRAIAIIMVVSVHTFNSSIYYADESQCDHVIYALAYMLRNLVYGGVPIFIMITGFLMLDKDKNLDIKTMYKKYIKRMFFNLLFWGTVFSTIEIFYNEKTFNLKFIPEAFACVMLGKSWAHLWYLYFIIAIYIMLPFIKAATDNVTNNTLIYTIAILFLFTILIPCIEKTFDFKLGFCIYADYSLLLLLLGVAFKRGIIKINNKMRYVALMLIIVITTILSFGVEYWGLNVSGLIYTERAPFIIVMSVLIFCIIIDDEKPYREGIVTKVLVAIADKSFGIYIVHMILVNFVYQAFHLNPIYSQYWLLLYMVLIVVNVIVSYVLIAILKKVPLIRKLL